MNAGQFERHATFRCSTDDIIFKTRACASSQSQFSLKPEREKSPFLKKMLLAVEFRVLDGLDDVPVFFWFRFVRILC